ncbi:hypothetical protein JXA63_03900 [Candidatus Woesebacteria bacterium]|nr:hypothetical protein [Candidatus Woesebacteria bacterium]
MKKRIGHEVEPGEFDDQFVDEFDLEAEFQQEPPKYNSRREPEEVQGVEETKWRKRNIDRLPDGTPLFLQGVVRFLRSLRPDSGTISYRRLNDIGEDVIPQNHKLTRVKVTDAEPDDQIVSRTRKTASKKGGATQFGTNIENKYQDQGADGTKIPKTGGFAFNSTASEIEEIREETGNIAQNFLRRIKGK